MHGYYQKNLKKWHKTLNSYMNYISYELESLTGQSYGKRPIRGCIEISGCCM